MCVQQCAPKVGVALAVQCMAMRSDSASMSEHFHAFWLMCVQH
jgi:hypothetical protein